MKRWTLVVSEETDKALRMFLAQNGGKKGDLSDFYQMAQGVKDRNAEYTSSDL